MSNKWELEHNDQGMDDDSKKIQIDQPSASKLQSPQFLGKDLARKGTPVNDESNQPGALNLLQRFNYTMSDVDVSMKSLSEAAFVSSWNSGDTAGVQQIDIAAIDEYTINAEDNQPNNLNTIVSSDSYNAETANISKNDSSNNDHNQMGDIEVSEDGTSYWITEYNHMNYIESEVEVETTNMIKNNEVDLRESKLQDDYMILRLNDTNKVTQDIISSTQTYYVLQKFEPDQHTRIIRGDFHLCDERFNELSRGKQYVAVSVVALCFLRINENPAAWKTSDINEILINGDVQHHASYKKLKRDGKTPQKKHLLISELYPYIKIGRNYFCFTEMDKVADNYVLNLRNLEASLNRCFYENESQNGIFTCDFYSFAIIRKSHSFFLLNSRATSYAGDPMNPRDQESAACLMQVFTIKCLANHLLVACNQGHRISEDEYETDILFSLINISTEKIKFGKEVSKRQKIKRDLSISLNMTVEVDKMKPSLRGDEGKKQLEAHKVISETHSKQVKVRNGSYGCSFGFNDGNLNCENKGTFQVLIGCGMLNIVIHANKNRVPYNPSKLYQFMKSDNGDLLNGKQQDPKVFWMCIIEVMENDKNNSAMFLFGHDITTILKCECCGSSSETNVNMTGHVIEVRGRHSVQEAIDAYFTAQVVETYTCEICNTINQWKAKKKHLFKSTPKILCLTLNRLAENGIKSKDNIGLNYQLTFTDFHLSNKATHVTYKLVSTINHIGTEISKGHCTATACCSSSLFYEFDDGRVHSVDAINESDAYILIYELSTKMEYDYEMTDLSNQNQHANGVSSEPLNECEMTDLCNESQHVNGAASEQSNIEDENNAGNRLQQFQDEFDFPDDTNIQCSDNIRLSGRRIVDYSFFFEQTRILHRHEFECEDSKMELIKETKLGLRSIVFFQCSSCGKEYQIQSCFKLDDMINVNKEAALGITSIGSGFYHLEELCSHLDIPCMSSSTFDRENKKLQNDWSTLAKCHTEQALQEEIELAFARGDVDSVGNALIPVVCDGSWGKRSYGKGFSSLSGAAAIIGVNTKKIIYFDTKNKYCNICTKSYAINCPPNDHPCNINYVGPSSGMETEIIVEGFKFCEKKGARFNKMISDGDSSAFKEIRQILHSYFI